MRSLRPNCPSDRLLPSPKIWRSARMISSSSPPLERGLDTMLIVYSLLQGHPAATPCEQFIRSQTGWFTTPLAIFEAKAVLTKVYGVPAGLASQKLVHFLAAPIA